MPSGKLIRELSENQVFYIGSYTTPDGVVHHTDERPLDFETMISVDMTDPNGFLAAEPEAGAGFWSIRIGTPGSELRFRLEIENKIIQELAFGARPLLLYNGREEIHTIWLIKKVSASYELRYTHNIDFNLRELEDVFIKIQQNFIKKGLLSEPSEPFSLSVNQASLYQKPGHVIITGGIPFLLKEGTVTPLGGLHGDYLLVNPDLRLEPCGGIPVKISVTLKGRFIEHLFTEGMILCETVYFRSEFHGKAENGSLEGILVKTVFPDLEEHYQGMFIRSTLLEIGLPPTPHQASFKQYKILPDQTKQLLQSYEGTAIYNQAHGKGLRKKFFYEEQATILLNFEGEFQKDQFVKGCLTVQIKTSTLANIKSLLTLRPGNQFNAAQTKISLEITLPTESITHNGKFILKDNKLVHTTGVRLTKKDNGTIIREEGDFNESGDLTTGIMIFSQEHGVTELLFGKFGRCKKGNKLNDPQGRMYKKTPEGYGRFEGVSYGTPSVGKIYQECTIKESRLISIAAYKPQPKRNEKLWQLTQDDLATPTFRSSDPSFSIEQALHEIESIENELLEYQLIRPYEPHELAIQENARKKLAEPTPSTSYEWTDEKGRKHKAQTAIKTAVRTAVGKESPFLTRARCTFVQLTKDICGDIRKTILIKSDTPLIEGRGFIGNITVETFHLKQKRLLTRVSYSGSCICTGQTQHPRGINFELRDGVRVEEDFEKREYHTITGVFSGNKPTDNTVEKRTSNYVAFFAKPVTLVDPKEKTGELLYRPAW